MADSQVILREKVADKISLIPAELKPFMRLANERVFGVARQTNAHELP
jgi:hypothetical protein